MRRNLLAALVAVGVVFGLASAALAMPSFVQQGVIPAGEGVGYAYVYKNLSRAELANAFAEPAAMKRLSRVSGEVMLQQMQEANPGLALPFEGTAGAARAIATDPNFQVVACRDGMFDGSNGTTLTNKSATVFGAHQRKCYVGENVLTYKGTVLMSMMCLNGRVTWTPPRPVAVGHCADGFKLATRGYVYGALPQDLKAQADDLMARAVHRDSRQATNKAAYEPDDVSRTMGASLFKRVPLPGLTFTVIVRYRDPNTLKVVREVGVIRNGADMGEIVLPGDPRNYIVETLWPEDFSSPAASARVRRIWLMPDESQKFCRIIESGIK